MAVVEIEGFERTRWDHRKFGTIDDPIHKSHMGSFNSHFACVKAFEYGRRYRRIENPIAQGFASGKACAGNAVHEVVYRALRKPTVRDGLLDGSITVDAEGVGKVYDEEFAAAADGREVSWAKADNPDKIREDRITMAVNLLNSLHDRVAEVVAIESAFIVKLGPYWLSGHIDLLYRPIGAPDTIAQADWKTAAQLPDELYLEHGFEGGFYSHALAEGHFLPRESITWSKLPDGKWRAEHEETGVAVESFSRFICERGAIEGALIETVKRLDLVEEGTESIATYGQFPASISYVHMPDLVPYARKQKKQASRPELAEFFGVDKGDTVECLAGDLRGPAWYAISRGAHDVERLRNLTRNIVGLVRMGRFYEAIDEKCKRCAFRTPCLTSGHDATHAEDVDAFVEFEKVFKKSGRRGEAA